MSTMDELRKAFDDCTVLPMIANAFECMYIPTGAATAMLEDVEAENAKLRELAVLNWEWAHGCCGNNCKMHTEGCGYGIDRECNYEREIWYRMRELGVDV